MDGTQAEALLARVAAQDAESRKSFRTLYEAFSRDVYAFAWNRLRDARESEEVVIDTMHELWRSAGRFRGDSAFRTWLLGIARHKILDRIRGREPRHEDIDELGESVEDESPDVVEKLAAAARSLGVQRCMKGLSSQHRECLHLLYFQDMSIHEMAAVQSVPEGTIKTRLFHARQKIKECLKALLQAEGHRGLA